MPNWCFNSLVIRGPRLKVEDFLVHARGNSDIDWGFSNYYERRSWSEGSLAHTLQTPLGCRFDFYRIVPIPDEVVALGYQEHGYAWSLKNFGTKWNLNSGDYGNASFQLTPYKNGKAKLRYIFDTAWSPPTPIAYAIVKRWPDLAVELRWNEEGNESKGSLRLKHDEEFEEARAEETKRNNLLARVVASLPRGQSGESSEHPSVPPQIFPDWPGFETRDHGGLVCRSRILRNAHGLFIVCAMRAVPWILTGNENPSLLGWSVHVINPLCDDESACLLRSGPLATHDLAHETASRIAEDLENGEPVASISLPPSDIAAGQSDILFRQDRSRPPSAHDIMARQAWLHRNGAVVPEEKQTET